ncbi:MAG TPA: alanine dehydrogenase, partial [Cyclobacteriaceae bacterium]|nr:alanine dehydrogenase [Cyclobacteriaceae bacterium]
MIIGVPKEIKNNENRVAVTPAGTQEFIKKGHTVYVQTKAGEGSGFSDEEYKGAGAKILATAKDVFDISEMIIKVKEPIEQEYGLIKKDQLVFTYFHFASHEPLAHAMIKTGSVCLAYETVERSDRSLPLLVPMSEVAGRMSIQEGAKYLEKPLKGRGILLGGVPGVMPAKVLI